MYGLGEPLDSLVLKIERAKKHILELESEYERFRRETPYSIGLKDDPQTGDRVYRLAAVKPIPKAFSAIIGDVLNNLRACLDHAVYAMVQVGKPSAVDPRAIFFPICGSSTEYKTRFARVIPGLRQDAVKAIDTVAPYVGGAGEYYWHLARLNNIDKHRLLLTIWGSFHGHTILPSQRKWVAEFQEKDPAELRTSFMALNPRVHLLNVGDVLLTIPKAEVEENMQFLIDIAFAEPDICRGNPVIETLHEFRNLIHHLIFEFDRFGLFR
jgi:hypothetical protein